MPSFLVKNNNKECGGNVIVHDVLEIEQVGEWLGINESHPLLVQNIFEECFDFVVKSTFLTHATPTEVRKLSFDNHNTLRYVAGFSLCHQGNS